MMVAIHEMWELKFANQPSGRQHDDHEHYWKFHQFGQAHTEAWNDKKDSNRPENQSSTEDQCKVDHCSFQNIQQLMSFGFRFH